MTAANGSLRRARRSSALQMTAVLCISNQTPSADEHPRNPAYYPVGGSVPRTLIRHRATSVSLLTGSSSLFPLSGLLYFLPCLMAATSAIIGKFVSPPLQSHEITRNFTRDTLSAAEVPVQGAASRFPEAIRVLASTIICTFNCNVLLLSTLTRLWLFPLVCLFLSSASNSARFPYRAKHPLSRQPRIISWKFRSMEMIVH